MERKTPCGQYFLRPMKEQDLAHVLEIERDSFSHPWNESSFREELRRGEISRCVVIEKGSEEPGLIAGFILAWMVADELHITNLAVAPEMRRKGIAVFLLTHLLDMAAEEAATWCTLEVRVSNAAARSLYKRFGFREVGVRESYYIDGEDAVALGLEL